jgi:uracil-DNA glycosylase family 4
MERKGFVGGSGGVLWKMAFNAGLDPQAVNRTNVAKRRPSNDDFGIFYHDPASRLKPTSELVYWWEELHKELLTHKPKVFVAVGEESLKAVCPSLRAVKGLISKYRGSVLKAELKGLEDVAVVPIYHPSWIMRMNWEWYYVGIKDLKRVKLLSQGHVLQEPSPHFMTSPSLPAVLEFLGAIAAHPEAEWFFDIETRGDSITCFSVSCPSLYPEVAMCVPIQTTSGAYWSEEQEAEVWLALARVFKANSNLINQNLAYDLDYMLDPYHIDISGAKFDPMIAHKFCYPELDKGLDFTTSIYTYVPYYKDEGKTWKSKVPDQQLWHYSCMDAWVTPKVAKAVAAELDSQGLTQAYFRRAHRMLPIALEMQRNRLRVNLSWREKLEKILAEERSKVHSQLSKLTGIAEDNLNVKSSPQVAHILYDELKLPRKYKRGSGGEKVSTEENLLKELRASLPPSSEAYSVINLILQERHLRTRESNYFNVTLDKEPSGVYWPFTVFINNDKSGRWESKSSPKWRGSKVTHIPKVIRLMFEPPPGRVFVQRDLSQAEARYVGAEAGCVFLNTTFRNFDIGAGPKIHKVVGKMIYGEEPKSDSMEYDTAKSIVHAYNYKMSFKRLAVEANISLNFASSTYSKYAALVPEVPLWHKRIEEEAIKKGYLSTPTGRKRQCFSACAMVACTGQLADEILRDLISWKPQATVPDILNEGLWTTYNNLPWVMFHQQGHDSHLDSIEPSRLEEYATLTEAYHRVPVYVDSHTELVIPSELSWGYLWGALVPYKPGDKGTYEEWLERASAEGYFTIEGKGGIIDRLYGMR